MKGNEMTVCVNKITDLMEFRGILLKQEFGIDLLSLDGKHKVSGNSALGIYALDLSKSIIVKVEEKGSDVDKFFESISKFVV